MPPMEELLLGPARRLTRLLELPPSLIPKLIYLTHWLFHNFTGYPNYTRKEISEILGEGKGKTRRELRSPNEEVQIYRSFSGRPYVLILTLALVHGIFVGKNLMFTFYTTSLVDLSHPEKNLKQVSLTAPSFANHKSQLQHPQNPNHTFTQFACLVTNCSRLSAHHGGQPSGIRDEPPPPSTRANSFAQDLIRLPIFAICKPELRAYVNPLIYTHAFGLIAACALAFFVFVMTCLVPIYSYLFPFPERLLLDVLCPRTARHRANRDITHQLESLFNSYLTHCNTQVPYQLLHPQLLLPPSGRNLSLCDNDLIVAAHCQRNLLNKYSGVRQRHGGGALASLLSYATEPPAYWLKMEQRRRAIERLRWFYRLQQAESDPADERLESLGSEQIEQSIMAREQRQHRNEFSSILEDCLPVGASDWFRRQWGQAFLLTALLVQGNFLCQGVLASVLVILDPTHANIYAAFARQSRLDQCGFWRLGQRGAEAADEEARDFSGQKDTNLEILITSYNQIELDKLIEPWSMIKVAEIFAFMSVPSLVLVISIVNFYHAMNMFNLMIADLRLQMVCIIELGHLITTTTTCLPTALVNSIPRGKFTTRQTPMRRIRNLLHEQVERVLIFFPQRRLARRLSGLSSNTKLDERIAYQEFALELLVDEQQEDPRELLLDLLERFHINYRMFMATFREHHAPVTTCFVFSYLMNYGFALIGLYWFRLFKSFVVLPLVLAGLSLFVANGLIVFCSRVHAGAGKLEPKFWSLMGHLAHPALESDERAKHLRLLWHKQLYLIDSAGGLSLRMFGCINVTYVAIIESVFYTSSIVLFTYSRTAL